MTLICKDKISSSAIIFIHGFNSSGQSNKAKQLRAYANQHQIKEDILCPDLPHLPAEAISLLEGLLARYAVDRVKLIGSSLGGFYATVLAQRWDVRAVLLNPAVHPYRLLQVALGEQVNYRHGERYQFTQQHLDALHALEPAEQLQRVDNIMLLVETGDQTLDYRDAVAYYDGCRQIVVPGGEHGFQSFTDHLSNILAF